MLDDPRVQRAFDWITTYQRFDDTVGNVDRHARVQRIPQPSAHELPPKRHGAGLDLKLNEPSDHVIRELGE